MIHLIVISGAALVLWLAVNGVERVRLHRRQYSQTPQALFAELCQAHGLSRTDRTLLVSISEAGGANSCCHVFLDPQVIRRFARNNPADAEDCSDLMHRLFGASQSIS